MADSEASILYVSALLDINEAAEMSEWTPNIREVFTDNGHLRQIAIRIALAQSGGDLKEKNAVWDDLKNLIDHTESFASNPEVRQEIWQQYINKLIGVRDLTDLYVAVALLNHVHEQIGMDLACSLNTN